jgi:hypothetical protein
MDRDQDPAGKLRVIAIDISSSSIIASLLEIDHDPAADIASVRMHAKTLLMSSRARICTDAPFRRRLMPA